jgi:hypothetical protein
VIDCWAGERKHDIADEHLKTTKVKQGLLLILVGRAQARVSSRTPPSFMTTLQGSTPPICADG